MSDAYKKAGVDVERGYEAVRRIKALAATTARSEILDGIGSFGAAFDVSNLGLENPVLVTGTDGVGTKLMLAFQMNQHESVGTDAVAMCVNDIVTQGAAPLFFLDYIACGKLMPEKIADIVKGIVNGCKQAGCALIGGETAEMPGMYDENEYDIAGFVVGAVEKTKRITGDRITEGDFLIGLASNGLHSNGFSLVRRIIRENSLDLNAPFGTSGKTLGEELLVATRIYVKPILDVLKAFHIHGMAHITGGGFYENIPRMLPEGLGVLIRKGAWPIPGIFGLLAEKGRLSEDELYRTFNMGIGMVLAVPENEADAIIRKFIELGERAYKIGEVIPREGVHFK
ncbi:phosphoribosylformylglycinamidine cyclo-ligase [Tuberibacillus calidus]|uniref:phosphoribosylformylglycinamidine cyclo-ligase n=1 Tax=Tuberibacillus calidus TaxID=340097 RepID=UPI00042122B9|nr:phosphoribosylformylglycinamidine cyclo-ligase [Tuberibacillus calidus]